MSKFFERILYKRINNSMTSKSSPFPCSFRKNWNSQFSLLKRTKIWKNPQKHPSRGVLWKGVLKISSKFTGEHPCRSAIWIKLQSSFIEITLRHGCSPVNFLHIFETPFPKNTSDGLLLNLLDKGSDWRNLDPFSTIVPPIYPLKTSENLRYRSGSLVENGLMDLLTQ